VRLVRPTHQVMNLQALCTQNDETGNVSAAFMTRIRQAAHKPGISEPSKLRKRLEERPRKVLSRLYKAITLLLSLPYYPHWTM